jgi:phosphopantothenoylcysteine synthetase/decarboxylase
MSDLTPELCDTGAMTLQLTANCHNLHTFLWPKMNQDLIKAESAGYRNHDYIKNQKPT